MSWVCKKCGKANRDDIKNCLYCNYVRPENTPMPTSVSKTDPTPQNKLISLQKKQSKLNATTITITIGSLTILALIAFLINLVIQINSTNMPKPPATTLAENTGNNISHPLADTYTPQKPKRKNGTTQTNKKKDFKAHYETLLDNYANLIDAKYFDYYIKLDMVSHDDKTNLLNLIESHQEHPDQNQYEKLVEIHNKLIKEDIYYYHIAKIKYKNKDYKGALMNLNNLETKFPESPLIKKADLLLGKILKN